MKTIIAELIALAETNRKGYPFSACVLINGNEYFAVNEVTSKNDPIAHAEIQAIRKACKKERTSELKNAIICCSGEPCPMCLTAIAWAGIDRVYYINPYFLATKNNFYYDRPAKEVNEFLHLNRDIRRME